MDLVTPQTISGAELTNPGLNLALESLQPGKLIHPAGQAPQVRHHQRAHRGITLCRGDPCVAVHIIGYRDRQILHSYTVTQFLCSVVDTRPARDVTLGAHMWSGTRRDGGRAAPSSSTAPPRAVTTGSRNESDQWRRGESNP